MLLSIGRTTHAYPYGYSQEHSTWHACRAAAGRRLGACNESCVASLTIRALEQLFEFLGSLGNPFIPVLERLATLDILHKGIKITNDGGILGSSANSGGNGITSLLRGLLQRL